MIHAQAKLIEILDRNNAPYEILSHEPVRTMEDVLRVLKVPLEQTAKTIGSDYAIPSGDIRHCAQHNPVYRLGFSD